MFIVFKTVLTIVGYFQIFWFHDSQLPEKLQCGPFIAFLSSSNKVLALSVSVKFKK